MKVTKKEFSDMLEYFHPSYIKCLIERGNIVADADGLVDLENPITTKWIEMRKAKLAKVAALYNINYSKPYQRRTDLSCKAIGMLYKLLSLPKSFHFSIENIIAESKENKWGVRYILRELKNFGYVSVETGQKDNGYFYSSYQIFENPKDNPNFNPKNQ